MLMRIVTLRFDFVRREPRAKGLESEDPRSDNSVRVPRSDWRHQWNITRDSKLTALERKHAAGDRLHFDPAPFDSFLAQLSPRERYAVDVPPGEQGPFITRGAVVRGYAAFYFLPAIQAPHAPLVFHYRFR